ncbi:uncharacterized protein V1510DRAFT_409143 [Dipodascopsis tothii]|uniref:uncharacterized protein n=1 Tax=Dipodascopsis tothii TaxID=44089 RepID=UPI0034CE12BE
MSRPTMGMFSKKHDEDPLLSDASSDGHTEVASPAGSPPASRGRDDGRDLPHHTYRAISPEPSEQTPLLILSDDPTTHPYNMFVIRLMRKLSFVFLAFSVLMFVLLLISVFFTIPGLHSRGSGYLTMFFFLVSIGNLSISLFSFALPSRLERILNLVLAGVLLIDFIILLSDGRLRHQEGHMLGVLTQLWTIFTALWVVGCDAAVEWSRKGQEERVSGRHLESSQAKWSCRNWFSVFWTLVLTAVLLAVAVLILFNVAVDAYDSRISPPGQTVTIASADYDVHVYCNRALRENEHHPTILIEAGSTSAEQLAAQWLEPAVSSHDSPIYDYRYCYWDRPGLGFSDSAPSPLSAGMAVDSLSDALNVLEEQGPWILVSHGVGGIYSRIFASRHAADVEGLVLVDTYQEEYFQQAIGRPARGFGYFLYGLVSPLGIQKQVGWIFMGRSSRDRLYGRAEHQESKYLRARLQEQTSARTFTRNEIAAARAILPDDKPIAVITAEDSVKAIDGWSEQQRDLADMSYNSTWTIVPGPHEVWRTNAGAIAISEAVANLTVYY